MVAAARVDKYFQIPVDNDLVGVEQSTISMRLTELSDGSYAPLSLDYLTAVSHCLVSGHKIMRAFGERETIQTTAAGEDLWRGNQLSAVPAALTSHTLIPVLPDAGSQLAAISESDADNGTSATGALTIGIDYIDPDGNEQTTSLIMNGLGAVNLTPPKVRFVQDVYVTSVGSNTVAEGNIRIYNPSTPGLVYNMIYAGGNQSLVPHRMVPLGKTLHLKKWFPTEKSKAKRTTVRLRADCTFKAPSVRQAGVFLFKSTAMLDGMGISVDLADDIPELSVVKASAWSSVAGAEVALHWWGILIDD